MKERKKEEEVAFINFGLNWKFVKSLFSDKNSVVIAQNEWEINSKHERNKVIEITFMS